MTAKDMLTAIMDMSLYVLKQYVSDFTDGDLMRRPAPGANHLAWQLGHLISSEQQILNMIKPGSGAELPAGFAERHDKATIGDDDPSHFLKQQEYLDLFKTQRVATKAVLAAMTEADFDAPGPERLRKKFPTVGATFALIAEHPMMHAGQFVVVRRLLGKPILI